MKKISVLLMVIIAINICGCKLLIKDIPETGIKYIPLEYEVKEISYNKAFDDGKIKWDMTYNGGTDVELTLLASPTDANAVEVSDVKAVDREIVIELTNKNLLSDIIHQPKIVMTITGLNPFEKSNYSITVKTDYETVANRMTLKEINELCSAKMNTNNIEPSDIYLKRINKALIWHVDYNAIVTDTDDSPISRASFRIDDGSKKIISSSSKNITRHIADGKLLGILNENIIYQSSQGYLSCYNIPKNTSSPLMTGLGEIDLCTKDIVAKKLYIHGSSKNNIIYAVDNELNIDKLTVNDLNDNETISHFSVNRGLVLLVTKGDGYKLRLIYQGESKLLKESSSVIEAAYIYDDRFFIVYRRGNKSFITKINDDGSESYIDDGTSPVPLKDKLCYMTCDDSGSSVGISCYDLTTGLKEKLACDNILSLDSLDNKAILTVFDADNIHCQKIFDGKSFKQICSSPEGRIALSGNSDKYKFVLNVEDKIYLIEP